MYVDIICTCHGMQGTTVQSGATFDIIKVEIEKCGEVAE